MNKSWDLVPDGNIAKIFELVVIWMVLRRMVIRWAIFMAGFCVELSIVTEMTNEQKDVF